MIIHSGDKWSFRLEWLRGRYGFSIAVLYGSWGLHIYLDLCQASLQIEIGG